MHRNALCRLMGDSNISKGKSSIKVKVLDQLEKKNMNSERLKQEPRGSRNGLEDYLDHILSHFRQFGAIWVIGVHLESL